MAELMIHAIFRNVLTIFWFYQPCAERKSAKSAWGLAFGYQGLSIPPNVLFPAIVGILIGSVHDRNEMTIPFRCLAPAKG